MEEAWRLIGKSAVILDVAHIHIILLLLLLLHIIIITPSSSCPSLSIYLRTHHTASRVPDRGQRRRVAIVGSGCAGLAAAHHLATIGAGK